MAARHVQCDPSTITRTAARDADFAANWRRQAGATKALRLIDRATDQEKILCRAAWLLRRNPEEFARRPPDTFTAEQVADVLAGFLRAVLPIVPDDCGQAVTEAFDEAVTSIADRVKRRYLKVAIADESQKPPAPSASAAAPRPISSWPPRSRWTALWKNVRKRSPTNRGARTHRRATLGHGPPVLGPALGGAERGVAPGIGRRMGTPRRRAAAESRPAAAGSQ